MIGIFSSKVYDKWDDFNYETVTFFIFHAHLLMVYIVWSLFVLREHVLMLVSPIFNC